MKDPTGGHTTAYPTPNHGKNVWKYTHKDMTITIDASTDGEEEVMV